MVGAVDGALPEAAWLGDAVRHDDDDDDGAAGVCESFSDVEMRAEKK